MSGTRSDGPGGIGRRGFCAGLLGGGVALAGLRAGDARAQIPVGAGLVLTYHALPAQRPLLRTVLQSELKPRLRQWQAAGLIAASRLLFNRHADADQWDALALLDFPDGGANESWNAVEREFPAGLDGRALDLLAAVHTVPVELARRRRQDPVPPSPVVLAIPYQALVPAGEYLAYADGYAIPQFDGWLQEGVLSQYSLWSASYPASRPWTHLLLLDYRSERALAERDAVVAKVRARLKNVPQWRAISETKKKVREEKQVVVADDLASALQAQGGSRHE